ncbi:MAG TPA: formate dehydrogenase accessory protein FdhE [Spirochaetota bacterium]|nr:formate dehydrogenase accessory protein FdhE [Spirochaetota bacterium]HPL19180.1 formate dehydrogenase accessory protein FdhE [Spirochaetota bacterium]HQJ71643.1 formate dehydrogenase accessory protein FdhE [Spirochaetota bacterium]HRS78378.1 formate dehydrogenase accessory protein FdhE [Spirochaetota bacterium]HRT76598.1 formate dehydrogenase accessory protein FdhE [Spirochaetota bacterium]
MHQNDISAFIIAGGQSRRFGDDKSLFMFRGRPLIEYVVDAIQPAIDRIAIIGDNSGKFAYLGLPAHDDIISGIGPLGGLYTALEIAETEKIFVFACDMPGLNTGLIRYMSALEIGNNDAIVPLIDGFYEPLHAVYSKKCIDRVEKRISEGIRQIVSLIKEFTIREVAEKEITTYADPKMIFRNINFKKDIHDLQPSRTGDTAMHDHLKYFNDNAEKISSAGILSDELVEFYRNLFDYIDKYSDMYLNNPQLPLFRAEDLPINNNDHARSALSDESVAVMLIPGLAPLIDMVTAFNPGLNLKDIHHALETDTARMQDAMYAILDMDMERLERIARAHKTGTDEALFIIINWLKPLFISLREKNTTLIEDNDESNLCPFCGNRPDMAAIVMEKGGKRYLNCSLCGHRWPFKRIACAVCGIEDASQLEYFSSEGDTRYRLDVCGSCGGYMKTVSLQKFEEIDDFNLTVENILTAHLDSAAIKKGYKKP